MGVIRTSYVFIITIAASTLNDTIQKTSLALSGKITKLLIDIPSGWAYNAGIRFEFGNAGSLPVEDSSGDTEKYFTGEDTDIPLAPEYKLNENKIKIYGKNLDTVNAHSCVVTIEIEQED